MADFTEDLIKIESYEVLGQLPDPFLFQNGAKLQKRNEWECRRKELYRLAVEIPYGVQPPEPGNLDIETLGIGSRTDSYRITASENNRALSFTIILFKPDHLEPAWPVVIDGDRCWDYGFNQDFLHAFLDRGIAVALFDRLELAADFRDPKRNSPLYKLYPEMDFGALSAWAWGYSRCVDALIRLGLARTDGIAFTGHSRGGKTAVLAGAVDQRARFVNPNNSGCGGCGCFRVHASGIREDGTPKREESLEAILDQFDYWFSPLLREYYGKADKLPFDSHFLKALIAPRILIEGNAASDLWANPVGSWQTAEAASEVFRFLGVPENHYWYYRRGYHWHKVEDVLRLAKIIRATLDGCATDDEFYKTPFRRPDKIFSWQAPVHS